MDSSNPPTLFSTNSERVKSVAFHPSEPLLAAGLFNGAVQIYCTNTWVLLRTIWADDRSPVRCVRWEPKLNWVVATGDFNRIVAFDYRTGEQVAVLENVHADYIRAIDVHPTSSILLSCSDDGLIKQISLGEEMKQEQIYEGHEHYVMDVRFNPQDPSTFASCSLDNTIKFWSLDNRSSNFTLVGHTEGVNCINFLPDKERHLIASGGDEFSVRLWDYEQRSCLTIFRGHAGNINSVLFHPNLPILISSSEDETVSVWNTTTCKKEGTYSFRKGRGWTSCAKGQVVALGFDSGIVVFEMVKNEGTVAVDSK